MNTLNNNVGYPEISSETNVSDIIKKAKGNGFSMIALGGNVYSIALFEESKQSIQYQINNFALCSVNDLNYISGPGKIIINEEQSVIKFNKSFEALYNISMNMADECIGRKDIEARFSKLEEEYQELVEAYREFKNLIPTHETTTTKYFDPKELEEVWEKITGEMADVLFVLLHIGHSSGEATAYELLHKASSKMLSRMADNTYIAKN